MRTVTVEPSGDAEREPAKPGEDEQLWARIEELGLTGGRDRDVLSAYVNDAARDLCAAATERSCSLKQLCARVWRDSDIEAWKRVEGADSELAAAFLDTTCFQVDGRAVHVVSHE